MLMMVACTGPARGMLQLMLMMLASMGQLQLMLMMFAARARYKRDVAADAHDVGRHGPVKRRFRS